MFLLKIIGSIIIIISSSLIGFLYGNRYSTRVKNLNHIQNCLQLVETEIIYRATPLPDALGQVYEKGNKNVSFIFKDIRETLLKNKNMDISSSFNHVLESSKDRLKFQEDDIEILRYLGRVIGTSDRLDQQKHLKVIMEQIIIQQREAQENRKKNEKMYKSLGILSGLAIIIILL
ncbi:stage III sporulation protein SpoIIIAB [Dethiothermospora halolimnae]|uniref:stage III sporulation protein SpoIIIAB n=1 Tax=Dethiothermospora halolimnae TaxID=3114390 RepID=UPI003CCB87ED